LDPSRIFKPVNIKVDIVLILGEVAAGLLIRSCCRSAFLIIFSNTLLRIYPSAHYCWVAERRFSVLHPLFPTGGGLAREVRLFCGCDISGLKSDHTPWRTNHIRISAPGASFQVRSHHEQTISFTSGESRVSSSLSEPAC
jgi:hypothetical protein